MRKTRNMKTHKHKEMLVLLSVGLIVLMATGILAQASFETVALNIEKIGTNTIQDAGENTASQKFFVDITLYPEKQVTDDGVATYKVVVKDLHKTIYLEPCIDSDKCSTPKIVYLYNFSFKAREDGTIGKFETDSFELGPGQSKSVGLKVKTKNEGASSFSVTVLGRGYDAMALGTIIYTKGDIDIPIVPTKTFFNGQGFILNKDMSKGLSTSVALLKPSDSSLLIGKMNIAEETFKISGEVFGDKVDFEIFSLHEDSSDQSMDQSSVADFSGKIQRFDDFILLTGKLSRFKGETWSLTVMSKNVGINPLVLPLIFEGKNKDTTISKVVSMNEFISIQPEKFVDAKKTRLSGEFYIKPVKIEKEKIFGIIPNPLGKNVVEIEVIKESQFYKKTIKENSNKVIEGYNLRVGALESGEEIEFSIGKAK